MKQRIAFLAITVLMLLVLISCNTPNDQKTDQFSPEENVLQTTQDWMLPITPIPTDKVTQTSELAFVPGYFDGEVYVSLADRKSVV